MILYLDAGSLLKRYVRHQASYTLDVWMQNADAVATSQVSLLEAAERLRPTPKWTWRQRGDLQRALEALEADWDDYVVMRTDERLATALVGKHQLGGFEALHLAGAMAAGTLAAPDLLVFSSFDRDLRRAARMEGLQTIEWDAERPGSETHG